VNFTSPHICFEVGASCVIHRIAHYTFVQCQRLEIETGYPRSPFGSIILGY
jgi:hypothetical protein